MDAGGLRGLRGLWVTTKTDADGKDMATNAGIYLLWKPNAGSDGYVLIHQRNDGKLSTPGGGIDAEDNGNAFVAAVRELKEESGIDLTAAPLSDFVWLGSSGGPSGDNYQFFARVFTSPLVPVSAPAQPSHIMEMNDYPFKTNGFNVLAEAKTVGGQSTRHVWASLNQLVDDFEKPVGARVYRPKQASRISDKQISYTPFVRTNLEKLLGLSRNGAAAYQPYRWPSGSTAPTQLPVGSSYVPPGVPTPSVAVTVSPVTPDVPSATTEPEPEPTQENGKGPASDDSIVTQVMKILIDTVTALNPAPTIGSTLLKAISAVVPTVSTTSTGVGVAAPMPTWASNYITDTEITQECKAAKFADVTCAPRFVGDRATGLADMVNKGQLPQAHAADLAAYRALRDRIATLTESGENPDELEKLQLKMKRDYPDAERVVFDPAGPGPKTRVMRIPNPYRAREYREAVTSFANPAPADNPDLQANVDVLRAVASPSIIADKKAATLLLESLWFCAQNPNGPGCYPEDVLQQFREYKDGKTQAKDAKAAAALLAGQGSMFNEWMRILKKTATTAP